MIEALKAAGGTPKYTEYPDAGHGIGNLVWGTKELLDWLLKQSTLYNCFPGQLHCTDAEQPNGERLPARLRPPRTGCPPTNGPG